MHKHPMPHVQPSGAEPPVTDGNPGGNKPPTGVPSKVRIYQLVT